MKVGRWKVLGLGSALAIGFVSVADAAQIRVTNDTFADVGLNMKIWYRSLDKRSNSTSDGGWSRNVFTVGQGTVGQGKIYFSGQITKLFKFYGEFDQERDEGLGSGKIGEAAIGLQPMKEFNIMAGLIRKPFSRYHLVSGYALLMPLDNFLDPHNSTRIRAHLTSKADGGLMIHGDLGGGVLTYRLGIFNEDRDNANKVFAGFLDGTTRRGWVDATSYSGKLNDKKNFEWAGRIEFQPLMLGFKPESAATITSKIADTRLGARDIFVIGLGYNKETHTPKLSGAPSGATGISVSNIANKTLSRTGWTIDMLIEKKFGNVIPNLQAAYISLDDSHFYYKYVHNGTHFIGTPKKGDTKAWYVQGQLLFDQVVGIGKPALAFRYEKVNADGEYVYNATRLRKKDLESSTFGLALNYYIRGQAARVSFGFDTTKYNGAASAYLKHSGPTTVPIKSEDRITDWYLYLQSMF
ncbi:MAG: hypothetical protein RMI93_05905 [Caldimicrobium sp.]|nr:hypothetical protein [Caldimicrobium sp.]MDW8183120.1 hypothetical protein [Caldimicrobium sp.]